MKPSRERISSSKAKLKRIQRASILDYSEFSHNIQGREASISTLPSINPDTLHSLSNIERPTFPTCKTEENEPILDSIIMNDSTDRPSSVLRSKKINVKSLTSVRSLKTLNIPPTKPKGNTQPEDYFSQSTSRGIVNENIKLQLDNLRKKGPLQTARNITKPIKIEKTIQTAPKTIEEKVKFVKEEIAEFLQSIFVNEELSQQLKLCFTHLKMTSDRAYSKYLVMPETEREVISSLTEAQHCLVKVFKKIKNIFFKQSLELESLSSRYRSSRKEVETLLKKIATRTEELNLVHLQVQKKETLLQNIPKQPEYPEMIWRVEKAQLSSQIEAMQEEIRKLEEINESQEVIITEYQKPSSAYFKLDTLEDEVDQKETKLFRMRAVLALADAKNKESRVEIEKLENKYKELEAKHTKLEKSFEQLKEREKMYREVACMSHEDGIQKDLRYKSLREQSQGLLKRCFESQHRLGRSKMEQIDASIFNNENNLQDQMIIEIARDFINAKDRVKRPILRSSVDSNEEANHETGVKEEQKEISLEKLALYKPTFYSLIEDDYKRLKDEANIDPEDEFYPINRQYLAMIRGIFDSKYNEFLYYENQRQSSPFPDFVYSWLNSFYICPVTKHVKAIDENSKYEVEKRRVGLFKFLSDLRLERTWDVSVFKDFLEEKYASDEIFFYLHCRHILFQGPQLNNLAASLTPIHWIQFDKCEKTIRHIFQDLDSEQYEVLLTKFKERAREKKGIMLVDSSLVLKALLETYRSQKKAKLSKLRESFIELSYEGLTENFQISFKDFKRIMDINYPSVSDIEKIRLYREAWCIGNGTADFKSFTIAGNESNFFLDVLKRDLVSRTPFFMSENEEENSMNQIQLQAKVIIQNKFKEFSAALMKNIEWASRHGLESVAFELNSLVNRISANLVNEGEKNEIFNLYKDFSKLIQISNKIQNLYFLTKKSSLNDIKVMLEKESEHLGVLSDLTNYLTNQELAETKEKNVKIKKFQRYFKHKKSNWYSLLSLLRPGFGKKEASNNLV